MRKKYRAIISDIDGTLLPPTVQAAPPPDKVLLKAVNRAVMSGVYFSVATARDYSRASSLIDGLGLKSLQILNNGATIYDSGRKKNFYECIIERKDAERAFASLGKFSGIKIIAVDNGKRIEMPHDLNSWKITKIVVLNVERILADRIFSEISQNSRLSVTISVSGTGPNSNSIHITDKKATKGQALDKLAGEIKIPLGDIIGIGDSQNDLSFLNLCGFKVAMGNATDEVMEIADYTAPPYWENGVAEVIRKFII